MYWVKIVLGAVIGAMLGFIIHFGFDLFCWSFPPGLMETPYHYFFDGSSDRDIEGWPGREHKTQAKSLAEQLSFICWLDRRGDSSARMALFVAFMGASSVMVMGRKHTRKVSVRT